MSSNLAGATRFVCIDGKWQRDTFQPFISEPTTVPTAFVKAFTAPVATPARKTPRRAKERAPGDLSTSAVNRLLTMGKRPQREITEWMAASCGMDRETYRAFAKNADHWAVANNPGEILTANETPAPVKSKRIPSGEARTLNQRLDAQCARWRNPTAEYSRSARHIDSPYSEYGYGGMINGLRIKPRP
jgi:hypothetical protein